MFNINKEVKDDICRSRFALFINNIKRDIKKETAPLSRTQ